MKLFFIVLIFVAAYATLRMSPKGPKDAGGKLLGYIGTFIVLVVLAISILPGFLRRQESNFERHWSGYWTETGAVVENAADKAVNTLGLGDPPPDDPVVDDSEADLVDGGGAAETAVSPSPPSPPGRYTVKAGDTLGAIAKEHGVTVAALQAENGISGDLITPGQVLLLPGGEANPAATATAVSPGELLSDTVRAATATPPPPPPAVDLQPLYRRLAEAKANGDLDGGEAIVADILDIAPEDVTALAVQEEIVAARERRLELAGLDVAITVDAARQAMTGLTLKVIDEETSIITSSCGEYSYLVVVSAGWLKNYQFDVIRCSLSGLGDGKPTEGEVFSVGGNQ